VTREARAESGPSNVAFDSDVALANIKTALSEAWAAASMPQDCKIDRMVAALAGAGRPSTQREWEQRLQESLPVRELQVVPDAAVLFSAADIQTAAIALVVGTGSIAWARDDAGTIFRAGGLGPIAGDEGSGYWIGQQAILRSANWLTDSPPSELLQNVLTQLGGRDFNLGVGHKPHGVERSLVASLSEELFRISRFDATAAEIISEAARHLTSMMIDASTQMSTDLAPIPWICAGGVALHQPEWLATIQQMCESKKLCLSDPIFISEPVAGALKLAMGAGL
jgi:N-acetylglucosamine kinase-like BadF-type ATPase